MNQWDIDPWTDSGTERMTGRTIASIRKERAMDILHSLVEWCAYTLLYWVVICLAGVFIGAMIVGALLTG